MVSTVWNSTFTRCAWWVLLTTLLWRRTLLDAVG